MSVKTRKKKSTDSLGTPPTNASVSDTMLSYKFEPYHAKPGEVYMNEQQLKHFRNILSEKKKDLMQEVDNTINEMKGKSVQVLADPNDRATEEEILNLELRARDRERKLIRRSATTNRRQRIWIL